MLTSRFEAALNYAFRLHQSQKRKGQGTPYVAHLIGVTALVLEDGGDEDQAIAALLHDAVEDQGGLPTLEEIRRQFGGRVAEIVKACSDSFETPKPPWLARKRRYLAHLPDSFPDAWRVSLADKVYNAQTILADLHKMGEATWERFKGGKEGTLWYYRSLAEIFRQIYPGYMADELARLSARMGQLADGGNV